MNEVTMTSNKPYLIRAIHKWISDNDCTPYLYIDTLVKGLVLPEHLFGDNPLILNASVNACKDLNLADEAISFQARFGGQVFDIYLPIESVIAIIARENGQGMTFELSAFTDEYNSKAPEEAEPQTDEQPKKSGLKVIR